MKFTARQGQNILCRPQINEKFKVFLLKNVNGKTMTDMNYKISTSLSNCFNIQICVKLVIYFIHSDVAWCACSLPPHSCGNQCDETLFVTIFWFFCQTGSGKKLLINNEQRWESGSNWLCKNYIFFFNPKKKHFFHEIKIVQKN